MVAVQNTITLRLRVIKVLATVEDKCEMCNDWKFHHQRTEGACTQALVVQDMIVP